MTDVLLINTACEKSSTNPRWAGQAGERSTTPKIYPAHARHCPLFSNHLKLDSHEDGMSWACSLGCGYLSCQWMMKLHSTGLHAGIIYYSDELILIIHSQPGLLLQNKSKALAKLYSSGQSITDSCGCGVSWAAVIRLSKNIVVSLISAAHAGVWFVWMWQIF